MSYLKNGNQSKLNRILEARAKGTQDSNESGNVNTVFCSENSRYNDFVNEIFNSAERTLQVRDVSNESIFNENNAAALKEIIMSSAETNLFEDSSNESIDSFKKQLDSSIHQYSGLGYGNGDIFSNTSGKLDVSTESIMNSLYGQNTASSPSTNGFTSIAAIPGTIANDVSQSLYNEPGGEYVEEPVIKLSINIKEFTTDGINWYRDDVAKKFQDYNKIIGYDLEDEKLNYNFTLGKSTDNGDKVDYKSGTALEAYKYGRPAKSVTDDTKYIGVDENDETVLIVDGLNNVNLFSLINGFDKTIDHLEVGSLELLEILYTVKESSNYYSLVRTYDNSGALTSTAKTLAADAAFGDDLIAKRKYVNEKFVPETNSRISNDIYIAEAELSGVTLKDTSGADKSNVYESIRLELNNDTGNLNIKSTSSATKHIKAVKIRLRKNPSTDKNATPLRTRDRQIPYVRIFETSLNFESEINQQSVQLAKKMNGIDQIKHNITETIETISQSLSDNKIKKMTETHKKALRSYKELGYISGAGALQNHITSLTTDGKASFPINDRLFPFSVSSGFFANEYSVDLTGLKLGTDSVTTEGVNSSASAFFAKSIEKIQQDFVNWCQGFNFSKSYELVCFMRSDDITEVIPNIVSIDHSEKGGNRPVNPNPSTGIKYDGNILGFKNNSCVTIRTQIGSKASGPGIKFIVADLPKYETMGALNHIVIVSKDSSQHTGIYCPYLSGSYKTRSKNNSDHDANNFFDINLIDWLNYIGAKLTLVKPTLTQFKERFK